MLEIITEIKNPEEIGELLKTNPGYVVIKFGATWCGPCKKVETQIKQNMYKLPDTVQNCVIDIDECFEIYAFFKSKRMVNGIPSLLAWKKGNISPIPDFVLSSSSSIEIENFFANLV